LNIEVRKEKKGDYRKVEEITRAAFYREERIEKLGVGCTEHYMVHSLRKKDGIAELSLVAEINGEIVGYIIYSNAHIETPEGKKINVLNFGPLSVLPKFQKKGVGSALMEYSIELAKGMGYGAILFFGHPTYYPRFGFVQASEFGITTSDGDNFPAFMAMELKKDFFNGLKGRFIEAPIYDEKAHAKAAAIFDRDFTK